MTRSAKTPTGRHHLRHQQRIRLRLSARQHEVSHCQTASQRGHNFAIVDEVDSILIDEARTPLIISGPSEESTDKYYKVNNIIPYLKRGEVIEGKEPGEKYTTGDYTVDEKHRSAALTEEGVAKVEKLLGCNLYEPQNWNSTTSSKPSRLTCSSRATRTTW